MTCMLYDFKRIKSARIKITHYPFCEILRILQKLKHQTTLSAIFSEFCWEQKHYATLLRHSASSAGNKNTTQSFCDAQRILRETKHHAFFCDTQRVLIRPNSRQVRETKNTNHF